MNIFAILPIIVILFSIIFLLLQWIKNSTNANGDVKSEQKESLPYRKRNYIFDSNAEFRFYQILNETLSDKYFIAPQIQFSHIFEVIPGTAHHKGWLSKIDKKTIDFVLLNKVNCKPEILIELDGPTHSYGRTLDRDNFQQSLSETTGVKLIRFSLKEGEDRDFIKNKILGGGDNLKTEII
jgi:CRISPR/Cas system-associated endoribonuclease Cas2